MENLPPAHFTSIAPIVDGAPGLSWEPRKVGHAAVWDARPDLIGRGYEPKRAVIWIGSDLTEHGRTFIRSRCVGLQARMDQWETDHKFKPIAWDGMLHSLIDNYLCDAISKHHENRYPTRGTTANLCRRLLRDRGSVVIAEIKYRTLLEWHKEWLQSGVAMAHGLMGQLGTLLTFGMTILECDHCTKVAMLKRSMRFPNAPPRKVWMTFQQIAAICQKAHELEVPSIAFIQALAWASSAREKDFIGEYVPTSEPGEGIIFGNKKWMRGAQFQELDSAFVWHHIQSKKGKPISPPLLEEPLFVEELNKRFPGCVTWDGDVMIARRDLLPASGPMNLNEATGLPYTGAAFRRTWRKVADAAGIPKHIQFRDTRASAITEATNAGVPIDVVAKAVGHTHTSQTGDYSRDQHGKHRDSMRGRVQSRVDQTAARGGMTMADVTGPISSLPGSSHHDMPEGQKCDYHPDRLAVVRYQGETDSFGCEMHDICAECLKEFRESANSPEARTGQCDWCKHEATDLSDTRDIDEGMAGPLYRVCGPCRKKYDDELRAELDAYDDDRGDWDDDCDEYSRA